MGVVVCMEMGVARYANNVVDEEEGRKVDGK